MAKMDDLYSLLSNADLDRIGELDERFWELARVLPRLGLACYMRR